MKRFYTAVATAEREGGWQVLLDGRAVRTVGGRAQLVPTAALAAELAGEWDGQAEAIDAARFILRDMADYAIDVVGPDRAAAIRELLPYAETDTLCYRAEPGEALRRRQDAAWEPLLRAAEQRFGIEFERISGIMHRPQPVGTLLRLEIVLQEQDDFALAALRNLAGLAASLTLGLSALVDGADPVALWDAASLEEDWQAEHWGKDAEAEERRTRRLASFTAAARFARLAQNSG